MIQRRFVQGVRIAVEMAQLSSTRLRDVLEATSVEGKYPGDAWPAQSASVFLDAWSLVDSIHRLRELLRAFPNMSKRGGLLKVFLQATSGVRTLRNHVQHLGGDLVNRDLGHLPVWGIIGWIWTINGSHTRFRSGVITAGADANMLRPILLPMDRVFHDPLDHITLSVGGDQINLSEAMRLVIRLGRAMEEQLRPQFEGRQPLPLVDALMLFDIAIDGEGDVPPAPANAEI